ncbi:unnamed protein product [Ostreobium quekettii]|uniref:Rad4 beta-hairpin domain-containing protein n=1 Tax=Ostreobium quekettii TaxID=121088 RepID=A0A8S1ILF8_9CHLO|nr:unnamed protein product [Ostreobium quekettii]|eukprot:evm.model.scf_242.5 EVM.evm.TU.scf_242.5   scf_242:83402-84749(+)
MLAALPEGTVHLRFPGLVPVCKDLGVDFAPAVVGFEYARGGRGVPKCEGVVVCEENEELVLAAYFEVQQHRAEAAEEKRRREAEAGWRSLLGAVWKRVQLSKRYSEDTEAADPTEGHRAENNACSAHESDPKCVGGESLIAGGAVSEGTRERCHGGLQLEIEDF